VTNNQLPEGFERSDAFATKRNQDIDKMGVTKTLLSTVTFVTKDFAKEIANVLIGAHTPVKFDYIAKYKISQKEAQMPQQAVIQKESLEGTICPRCREGRLVKRKRKSKKFGMQYASDEFFGCSKFPGCRYTKEI
jgi:hypothetical protein